jgi:hypothetical protein
MSNLKIKTKIKSEKEFAIAMITLAALQELIVQNRITYADEKVYWKIQDECIEYLEAQRIYSMSDTSLN